MVFLISLYDTELCFSFDAHRIPGHREREKRRTNQLHIWSSGMAKRNSRLGNILARNASKHSLELEFSTSTSSRFKTLQIAILLSASHSDLRPIHQQTIKDHHNALLQPPHHPNPSPPRHLYLSISRIEHHPHSPRIWTLNKPDIDVSFCFDDLTAGGTNCQKHTEKSGACLQQSDWFKTAHEIEFSKLGGMW